MQGNSVSGKIRTYILTCVVGEGNKIHILFLHRRLTGSLQASLNNQL